MSGETILLAGVALSFVYCGVALACFEGWRKREKSVARDRPVTFFRPLKGGVRGLREKLAMHAAALEAEDQMILGVEAESAEARLCEEVRAAFALCDIVVVRCARDVALNPKISKLVQMAPLARHEHWVVADSEVWLEARFLTDFRGEWETSGADVLTAAYRVQGMRNWPERLDAAAVLLTLVPGLAVLRAARAITFTLGACTAFRRGDLAAVGGWAAFGGALAEDNRLGASLTAAGRTIRLSAHVVTLESDPLGWREWWRHQRRVAVTYRLGNPAGFAGSIVTHGEFWALLLVVVDPRSGLALLAGHWVVRTLVAGRMARRLEFPIAGLPLAVLGASLAGTACWLGSWFTVAVWWGGRWWRVRFWAESTPAREFVCPKEALPP